MTSNILCRFLNSARISDHHLQLTPQVLGFSAFSARRVKGSAYLNPSIFHLFPGLKHLRGRRYEDDELIAATEGWFGDQDVEFC